jgi:hypothetical protein
VSAPTIDTSRHPIVVVRFSGYISEPEFDVYLASMTQLISRSERTLTILDARRAIRNPPSQRKKQADWLKANEQRLRQYSLGTAFVITSPFVRGVLTAILWLQPLPNDHTVVSTMAEAEDWAAAKLRAAGMAFPVANVSPGS